MQTLAFSLYDMKTGIFGTPFFTVHPAHAVRSVADLAADLSTVVGRHPADYTLYQVGQFDDSTGMFGGSVTPIATVPQILEQFRPAVPLPPVVVHDQPGELRANVHDGNGERA